MFWLGFATAIATIAVLATLGYGAVLLMGKALAEDDEHTIPHRA